ncbi:MAG: cytosine methyltransferase [Sulfuricurvum sp. PC08-66]|nr:MAG: cytosine methyltransferase [Sulfuricurvum sp. PC08-66]
MSSDFDSLEKKRIKTIELFAGVGGFRIGLEKIEHNNKKYEIVWSNQWEPATKAQHASDIYCMRFGKLNHSNQDISTVHIDEIPNHDLLVGGFPCQDYSVATSLKNSAGIVGKKGVLWWQIHRILEQKKENAPSYLMLENVDRLLKSPAKQRGRDFALMLSSLNSLGYAVEWRVIDASEYGMPQRRKRVYILAYKIGTELHSEILQAKPVDILNANGLFAQAFPIRTLQENEILQDTIGNDLVKITNSFNKEFSKNTPFLEAGFMIDGKYYTSKVRADYKGDFMYLKNVLVAEENVPNEFYINESELQKWTFLKGSKTLERVSKSTGHMYKYSEGSMSFPDSIDKPARTIITGEGGASPSRFKHVIHINGKYRRLMPVELEKLNMFPENHTLGVTDTKRAFLMGNALVVGVIEKLGEKLIQKIGDGL